MDIYSIPNFENYWNKIIIELYKWKIYNFFYANNNANFIFNVTTVFA